jgi:hypothetical protein
MDDEVLEGDVIPEELRQVVKDDEPRDMRRLGFDNMTKDEVREMALRSVAVRRAKRRAKQIADLKAFTDAHRELAGQLLGAKMALLDGLLAEMDTGKGLDTSLLSEARMKVLIGLVDQMEKRGFGNVANKTENHSTLDIRAAVVDLTKALQKPDSV